jgi:hypothetical protein
MIMCLEQPLHEAGVVPEDHFQQASQPQLRYRFRHWRLKGCTYVTYHLLYLLPSRYEGTSAEPFPTQGSALILSLSPSHQSSDAVEDVV